MVYISIMLNEEFFVDIEEPAPLPTLRPPLKDYQQNFVMELALALESPDALCMRYDVTPHEFAILQSNPTFMTDLTHWKRKMADEGLSFKLKARVQAESYLADIDDIIADPNTSKETKLSAISRIVSWGGLDVNKNAEIAAARPSVTINITRFSEDKPNVIEIN